MNIVLTPDTTVLELAEYYPETEAVFDRYRKRIGVCICCECLFCSVKEVARRYELDLDELMARLSNAIESDAGED